MKSKHEPVQEQIFLIRKACPVCKSDVKGNKTVLFYCEGCNILYRIQDLEGNT